MKVVGMVKTHCHCDAQAHKSPVTASKLCFHPSFSFVPMAATWYVALPAWDRMLCDLGCNELHDIIVTGAAVSLAPSLKEALLAACLQCNFRPAPKICMTCTSHESSRQYSRIRD